MGTVTVGGVVFNIYGTRNAADDYMKPRLGADAWNTASSGDKDKALVSGTRFIDRQNWQGQRTSPSQTPPEFPRTGLTGKDGNAVGSVSVPLLVEEANYEMALLILADATVTDKQTTGSNVKGVKAGSVAVDFFRQTDGSKLPTVAHELIGLWLDGAGGSDSTGNCASGADGVSTFDDIDQWGRTVGFP